MARETDQQLRRRAAKIQAILRKTYPRARCALNFSDPLELLVATILSAQTTDKGVNIVTADLFKEYRTAQDYASADVPAFEQAIRPTGFFRNKTKAVMGAARKIVDDYGGNVPDTMDALLTLPGVGRKTATVVLGNAFGKNEGVTVDRHVARVSTRMGLTANTDPVKIEQDLMKLVPRARWTVFSHMMILHGRSICAARRPDCAACAVSKFCPSAFKA